jgi:very-short-patch-repair endonuclease
MSVTRTEADNVIMALAARQHGVVARAQLLAAGVTNEVVEARVRRAWLHRVHRGVYRVGPLVAQNARVMAAVLVCGEGTVVSGRSAAELWRMIRRSKEESPVEVIVAGRHPLPRPGVVIRQAHSLRAEEVTVLDGIPIATPARTLYDLASLAHQRELESALAEALLQRLVGRADVLALLDRHASRPGASRLRALVTADKVIGATRSEAEERFLALIRKAQLHDPATNVELGGYQVDFLWRRERLVVEVDGQAYHSSRRRFESDRRRDADLVAAGMRVMRVTWSQIVSEPEALVARVAQALARPVQA